MKQKVLITTNTYFQLIVAVQLKLTRFAEDDVDVIITDHSEGCKQVSMRIGETGLFRDVFYVPDRDGRDDTSVMDKIRRYTTARLFPTRTLNALVHLHGDYDLFLFNNASLLSHLIRHVYRRQITCYRFEEGFSTYTRPFLGKKAIRRVLIRTAFGDLEKHVKGLYLFHPELLKQSVPYPILPIEPMRREDDRLKQVLNHAFAYTPGKYEFPEKYLFMEESFRASGVEMDDVELACAVADVVGRENLAVKRHPRSPDNPFAAEGLKTTPSAQVPWEVILMNEDFTGKTLLTITSGSVLAGILYFNTPIQGLLLFRCTQKKSPMLDEYYLAYLSALCDKDSNVFIPTDKGELLRVLRKNI